MAGYPKPVEWNRMSRVEEIERAIAVWERMPV